MTENAASAQVFTIDAPENGCFYRVIDQRELDILLNRPKDYGLFGPTIGEPYSIPELALATTVKGQRCQKFRPCRRDVMTWARGRAALLIVEKSALQPNEYEAVDQCFRTDDILIVGAAVVRTRRVETIP